MDLVEFLRARLDEDAEQARAAGGGRWHIPGGEADERRIESVDDESMIIYDEGGHSIEHARHIARHDPARVLAEVDAKRRIVDHYERWAATLRETPEGWTATSATSYRMAMEWTVTALADAYINHPDHPEYREEWKP